MDGNEKQPPENKFVRQSSVNDLAQINDGAPWSGTQPMENEETANEFELSFKELRVNADEIVSQRLT